MSFVVQCPKCELRFTNEVELQDHLERDHHRPDAIEADIPEPRIPVQEWHHHRRSPAET